VLGPEMRSTGEVLGMADSFEIAFFKSQVAAGSSLPLEGTALITVASSDRQRALIVGRELFSMGFTILATKGTAGFFKENGVECEVIKKMHEGRPNIVDAMHNREIQFVLNTPIGKEGVYEDSYIRKSAIKYNIPYHTTTAAALAAAMGIRAARENLIDVRSVQSYHRDVD
jgi:carbamoyl-phosphate synthase large subunit